MDREADLHIRLADVEDDAFILGLVPRFVDGFELPKGRRRGEFLEGIRRDIARHLTEQPAGTHVFVAENDDGERVGFLHLHTNIDFFSGGPNCHISDLAVADGHDGQGIGRALLAYAERWAREHRCKTLGLAVFPGNERARALYEQAGFGVESLRMVKLLR